MSSSAILVLGLFAIAAIFFVTEWLHADPVALLLLVAFGATNILTPQETFSGFSRSAVITILVRPKTVTKTWTELRVLVYNLQLN